MYRAFLYIPLLLTNKCTIFDANTFLLLIKLLHVLTRKHHHQEISLYLKVTKSIKVKSAVIYRCHRTIKRLKHHVILYSKLVTILKVYRNYSRCAIIHQTYVVALHTIISVWIYVHWTQFMTMKLSSQQLPSKKLCRFAVMEA